ncbi:MAG: hypothetical protein D6736_10130, partial [Nitrospinota bacterium]
FSMELLAKAGVREAVDTILTQLHSPRPRIRQAAIQTLGVLGDGQHLPLIADLLHAEEDPELLVVLIHTFGQLAARSFPLASDEGVALGNSMEEYVVTQLSPFLRSPHPSVKAEAIIQLVNVGGLDGVILSAEMIKQMMRDPDARERERSAYVLGELKIKSFFPQLMQLAHDPATVVQQRAIEALGKIQDCRAVQPLVDLLPEETLRPAILTALEQIAAQDCQQLVQVFQKPSAGPEVRQHIPWILKDIKDAVVNELLTRALLDPDPEVQSQVLRTLEHRRRKGLLTTIDQTVVESFIHMVAALLCRHHLCRFRIKQLAETMAEASLLHDHLSACLRAEEERIFRALSLIYGESVQSIYSSFLSSNPALRSYALEALHNLLPKEQQELLLPLLEPVPEYEMVRLGEQHFRLSRFTLISALETLLGEDDPWMTATIYYLIKRGEPVLESELPAVQNPIPSLEEEAMLSTMDKALFLKSVPLFANLDVDDLFFLAQITEEKHYPSNTTIFQQGDIGDSLFLIISGEVDVLHVMGEEAHLLNTLGPKDFFGEMAILSEEPRSASVRTRSQVSALVIEKEDFKEILNRRPEIALEIIRVLIARLKHSDVLKHNEATA